MQIILRTIETISEFKQVAELENRVWGFSPIPLHQTITAAKNGGIVLGAFAGEKLVGFSYGFAGFANKEVYLCSHMMGIDSDYRDHGVGYSLKLRQAEEARKLGYQKIRWTYDPLESRNGYLNLSKLGAFCCRYLENCYGEMTDELNRGLPSDRFNVEWHISQSALENRKQLVLPETVDTTELLLDWSVNSQGLPVPKISKPQDKGVFRFVAVPVDFQAIRKTEPELAFAWRMHTRREFSQSFSQGWAACKVLKMPQEPVVYYLLAPKPKLIEQ